MVVNNKTEIQPLLQERFELGCKIENLTPFMLGCVASLKYFHEGVPHENIFWAKFSDVEIRESIKING